MDIAKGVWYLTDTRPMTDEQINEVLKGLKDEQDSK